MKKNEKLLQEAFFKKESYADKLKKKYPQYEPQDVKVSGQPGFGSILDTRGGVLGQQLAVTDTKEATKRLIGTFGASVGVNTVKNIASRSIKSFPVVISDHIEPETSVMLKKLMEEQYAEYINLLVSNQVIDISQFKSGDEGNIAIQALDVLSGADFGTQAMAKKALRGELSPQDIFGNYSSFNLIRNEEKEYKTGVAILDALLEGAVILPKEESEKLVEFVSLFPEEITSLNENEKRDSARDDSKKEKIMTFAEYLQSQVNIKKNFDAARGYSSSNSAAYNKHIKDIDAQEDLLRKKENEIEDQEIRMRTAAPADFEAIRSNIRKLEREVEDAQIKLQRLRERTPADRGEARFSKLTSTDVLLDPSQLKDSMDQTMGELLLDPRNYALKDKFEKATFLLQSSRIAGIEYIEYVVQRLGLPISKRTRESIVQEFKVKNVVDPNETQKNISKEDIKRLQENRLLVERNVLPMFKYTKRAVLLAAAVGVGAGVGSSATLNATGLAAAGTLPPLLGLAIPAAIVAPALIGGAALAATLWAAWKIRKVNIQKKSKIFGWERVEALIALMEQQRADVLGSVATSPEINPMFLALTGKELEAELNKYGKEFSGMLVKAAREKPVAQPKDLALESELVADFDQDTLLEMRLAVNDSLELLESDKEYQVALSEAKIQTTIPVQLTKKYEYDKSAKPEVLVAPTFSSRSAMAYGSVEYDKRELKDRKYNAPLIMKITFKERFADGSFADNELVAVIGILGVITRVPSEEMKYILSSNAEGLTLKDILKPEGSAANLVSDILGLTKLKKDIESLPQSADVWENLEKVARLAVSNKLAGKASGNIANAHLIFSQKEVDEVRTETGKDYLKDKKLSADLMKRYSAFTLMIANDVSERVFIYDDPDSISWSVVPYSAIRSKDTGDQLTSALMKIGRM